MPEPHWIDPALIRFKISPHHDLSGTQCGDWDIDRRHPFKETAKYQAIVAHYVDGVSWLETELFRGTYARRLKRDGHVGRCRTLDDLAADYDRRFDPMVREMRREGFRLTNAKGKTHALPLLLIGRSEVFIGNQGNHRLAIAQMLGLENFAGRILCRHPQ